MASLDQADCVLALPDQADGQRRDGSTRQIPTPIPSDNPTHTTHQGPEKGAPSSASSPHCSEVVIALDSEGAEGKRWEQPYNRYAPSDVDYEKKYAPDPYGEELGPKARIWNVYNDEAQMADAEMVQGLNGTIDVLLIFAGLFSAVVTTFVVQSSQALSPDYAQITASLIYELARIQRAIAAGTPVGDIPASELNFASETHTTGDLWVNGLWLTSLTFSLLTALICVLAKQWIQHFNSTCGSTPRDRAFLPVLLNVALLLFFAGLVVYVAPMNATVSYTIIGFSAAAFLAYALTVILPPVIPHCAFKTPISDSIIWTVHTVVHVYHCLQRLPRRILVRWDTGSWPASPRSAPPPSDLKSRDLSDARRLRHVMTTKAIDWLCFLSSNASAATVSVQAVAALPTHFDFGASREAIHKLVNSRTYALEKDHISSGVGGDVSAKADFAERLTRSLLHFTSVSQALGSSLLWQDLVAFRGRIPSPQVDAMLRIFLLEQVRAHGNHSNSERRRKHLRDALHAVDTDTLPVPLSQLRLHHLAWHHLYSLVLTVSIPHEADPVRFNMIASSLSRLWAHGTRELWDNMAISLSKYRSGAANLPDLEQIMCRLRDQLQHAIEREGKEGENCPLDVKQ
ncbi:hypothetical protein K525DRAFT_197578 [Schizophyllum commune Loenen D]|nr:hypothetical protein K525DRAFT_197578 [Schizophyllum commune Loenen D]